MSEQHAQAQAHGDVHAEGQQHPLGIYFKIWIWLFILSTGSYLTDFLDHGLLRWALIIIFMLAKAGLIVAVFMHMVWERLALIYAILAPPVFILVFVALMTSESGHTLLTRTIFFSGAS